MGVFAEYIPNLCKLFAKVFAEYILQIFAEYILQTGRFGTICANSLQTDCKGYMKHSKNPLQNVCSQFNSKICKQVTNTMQLDYKYYATRLQILCNQIANTMQLDCNSLQIDCKPSANRLQTVCNQIANSLQIDYILKTWELRYI